MGKHSAADIDKHSAHNTDEHSHANDAGGSAALSARPSGRHNWLVSLAVNAVILAAVLYFTDLMYETNDDFAIAEKLAAGYPYVGFVNYYLCRALMSLQALLPSVGHQLPVLPQLAVIKF